MSKHSGDYYVEIVTSFLATIKTGHPLKLRYHCKLEIIISCLPPGFRQQL